MAAFGAVGRFGVAGWREDLLVLAFKPETIVLVDTPYQPGSGQKVLYVPDTLILEDTGYAVSFGAAVTVEAGDPLSISDQAFDAQAGASSQPIADPLVLGELSSAPITGATVNFTPDAVTLDEGAYFPSAGLRIDFVLPDEIALSETGYGPQAGAAVSFTIADTLALEEAEFDIPAGNRVDVTPYDLDLDAVAYAVYTGVTIDFAVPTLVLGEASYAPGSGTVSTFVPASEFILSDQSLSPQTGASIFVRPSFREFYASAVAATAVAGGPFVRVTRHFRMVPVAMDPQTGASPAMTPEAFILNDIAFEIGARRKPVRGQFLIYN